MLKQSVPNFVGNRELNPGRRMRQSGITERWRNREISNFQYLLALNSVAGRSYNDITQYPVFPWILADYESETLDLNRPTTFRDLRRPVGALNPRRLEMFLERYDMLGGGDIPKFHYGSHYSNAGMVLLYLMRLEPFTTLHIDLQVCVCLVLCACWWVACVCVCVCICVRACVAESVSCLLSCSHCTCIPQ